MAPSSMPGWMVTNQRTTTELDPATGKATKGVAIAYTTALGNAGELFVPQATYNLGPDKIKPLLDAACKNMDAIHRLSG